MQENYEHDYVRTNGITLHVVKAGPQEGPLVILLHGYPEFWYGWRAQIPALINAGYHVWVPDQRGYNLSDKPQAMSAYTRNELALDVIGLIDSAGCEKAFVIGHDWGGAVAWWLASKYPDRVLKLGILNVPHFAVMSREALRRNWTQLRRSWYMFFFQIPWLPEAFLRAGNWRGGLSALRASAHPDTFTEDDLSLYQQAWSQPGAVTAMLNWYRAAFQKRVKSPEDPRIRVPTLMIWGAQDIALGRELAQPSIAFCDDGRLLFVEEATHWVQHDASDQVNAWLIEFLGT